MIDNSTLFQIRVTLEGKRSDLYAGHFTLAEGMSYGAAIDALSTPPVRSGSPTVTIPEGYSRSQAAAAGRGRRRPRQLHEGDGQVEVPRTRPSTAARRRKNLEGFLFPDTFELKPKAPVARPGPAAAAGLQAADQEAST